MKKIFLILLFSLLLAVSTVQAANWTFAVYLDADNNLESAGIDDVNEMELPGSVVGNVNIIVQFDRASGYDSTNGDWTSARRYYITQDSNTNTINSTLIQDLGEVDMANVSTLVDFINWSVNAYPAQHHAVILWNHGSGWKSPSFTASSDNKKEDPPKPKVWEDNIVKSNNRGIIWDDSSGNSLSLQEVRQAFEQAYSITGVKLDLIGMDACLMQMVEIGYELRNHSDVLVGSEENEPGDGWDYNGSLVYLTNNPTASPSQLGSQIVSSYFSQYGFSGSETQSAVNQSNMINLRQAIDNFAQSMINGLPTYRTQITTARSNSYDYNGDSDYVDLFDFASKVNSGVSNATIQTAAVNVMAAVGNTVLAEIHGSSAIGSNGISIYYPSSMLSSYNATLFAQDGLWDDFLINISYIPPDSYENDDNYTLANWITTNAASQGHNFAPAGDQDYIKFNATVNHSYIIETFNLSSSADTYLYLYNTNGQSLITSDDDGGAGFASKISWTCSASGTYYAMVEHYSSSGTGSYYVYVNDTSGVCNENWVVQAAGCNSSDQSVKIYTDANSCGTTTNLPGDNGTVSTCNFCSYNITNTTWSAWQNQGTCLINDTGAQNRSKIEYDTNYASCYAVTGLPSDLWNNGTNITHWEVQSGVCNYCSPNPTNTSWTAWQNQTSCLTNDIYIQNRTFVEYDADHSICYAVTGLSSDLWNNGTNITHIEYQNLTCDFCTPSWYNINTSCASNDQFISWYNDSNNCYAQTNLASDNNAPNNNTYYCDYNNNGIIGDLNSVNTTHISNLGLDINQSSNLNQNFTGTQSVQFEDNGPLLFEFNFNFDLEPLNLMTLAIEKQPGGNSFGYLIIQGLDLTSQSQTKTVYLDRILNGTGICIKDSQVASISEITSACTGAGETWSACPGSSSPYVCTINSSQYKITGLSHSAVKEQATYCGDGTCNGAESCSSCSLDCGSCGGSGSSSDSSSPYTPPSRSTTNQTNTSGTENDLVTITPKDQDKTQTSPQTPIIEQVQDDIQSKGLASITGAFIGVHKNDILIVALVAAFTIVFVALVYKIFTLNKIKSKVTRRKLKKKLVWSLVIVVVAAVVVSVVFLSAVYFNKVDTIPTEEKEIDLDQFAQCLFDQKVTYYGHSGECPECRKQEAMFGEAFQYLKYVDCDQDPQRCGNEKAVLVPSWRIDWEIYSGVKDLEELSSLSGCYLS